MKERIFKELTEDAPIPMEEFINRCTASRVEVISLEDQYIPVSKNEYPTDVFVRKAILKHKGKTKSFKTVYDYDLFRVYSDTDV